MDMRSRELRMGVFMRAPSPHMTEFYRCLSQREDVDLRLVFREASRRGKPWGNDVAGLQVQVLRWETLSTRERVYQLRELASREVDCWVLGESLWDVPNATLLHFLQRRHQRAIFIGERIAWNPGWRGGPTRSLRGRVARPIKRQLSRIVLSRYDAVAAMGAWGASQYRELLSHERVFITRYSSCFEAHRSLVRSQRLGMPVRLGFSGQLIERKGILALCRMLFPALRDRSDWSLVIAGEGPQRTDLERLINSLDLADRVSLRGFIPAATMPSVFWNEIDCLLVPSRYDGWGMVIPEALHAAVPVISTPDVGASQQYIRNGANGWIASLDEMVPRVLWSLRKPHLLGRAGEAARASVSGETPQSIANDFVADVASLL